MKTDLRAPLRKPPTLHDFLAAAARATFPRQDHQRSARAFILLSERRTKADPWISRSRLAQLLAPGPTKTREQMRRVCNQLTNAINNLREHTANNLSWVVPHLRLTIEGSPKRRSSKYRLKIDRIGSAWDFAEDEAPQTIPETFHYQFGRGSARTVKVRPWATVRRDHTLLISAEREPPDGEWKPPVPKEHYRTARDRHFAEVSAKFKTKFNFSLRRDSIWGIQEAPIIRGESSTRVRIVTTRTNYADLLFFKDFFDQEITTFPKQITLREWLKVEVDPRTTFCPPRDALCVSVIIVVKKPKLTLFTAKQRSSGKAGVWDATAAGAASVVYQGVADDSPDLVGQVSGVVYREVGLKIDSKVITWLGFGRGAHGNSTVVALVEVPLSVNEVQRKFTERHALDDIEVLEPVPLKKAETWLDSITPTDRGEFLEFCIALTAVHYGTASIVEG